MKQFKCWNNKKNWFGVEINLLSQKNFYNLNARNYFEQKKLAVYAHTEESRTLGKWCKLVKGKRVLDVGAGFGNSYPYLMKAKEIVMADISENLLKIARKNIVDPKVSFILTDFNKKTSFRDNYFDVLICNGTLHHLDPNKALPELNRILKPRGLLCVGEPLKTSEASFFHVMKTIFHGTFLKNWFIGWEDYFYNNWVLPEKGVPAKEDWGDHPPDYEFTIKELDCLFEKNGFEWVERKVSWLNVFPLTVENNIFLVKLNYFLSDLVTLHPRLKDSGKNVHGWVVKSK